MRIIGNLIWWIFGGLESAICYFTGSLAVDGGQSAAVRPVGQLRDGVVAGEIKALQLGKTIQHGDIGNGVAGDAQILQRRQTCQLGDIDDILSAPTMITFLYLPERIKLAAVSIR